MANNGLKWGWGVGNNLDPKPPVGMPPVNYKEPEWDPWVNEQSEPYRHFFKETGKVLAPKINDPSWKPAPQSTDDVDMMIRKSIVEGYQNTPGMVSGHVYTPEEIAADPNTAIINRDKPHLKTGRDIQNEYEDKWLEDLGGSNKFYELTADDYYALSPRERAAVDYNTALSEAIEADYAIEGGPADDVKDAYFETADRVFMNPVEDFEYRPNTLAFLDSLGLTDMQGNIEQYVDGTLAVDDSDRGRLEALGPKSNGEQYWNYVPLRDQLSARLVDSTQAMQKQLNEGRNILTDPENFSADIAQFYNESLQGMGGVGIDPEALTAEADAQAAKDEKYGQAFELISRKDTAGTWGITDLVDQINAAGIDQGDFFNYIGNRLDAWDGKSPLGINGAAEYFSPDEIKKMLGLKLVSGG